MNANAKTQIKRNRQSIRLAQIVGAVGVFFLMLFGLTASAGHAQEHKLYDWTVCITTQHLERQFKFKESRFENKVDRLDADIYYLDHENEANPYESLWYCDGKPLGLELFNRFSVEKGHGICIRVKHKNGDPEESEMKAAANAILRVWVDARLNQSASFVVKVPASSFYQIVDELRMQGMTRLQNPTDITVNDPLTLLVQAESSGASERMVYR